MQKFYICRYDRVFKEYRDKKSMLEKDMNISLIMELTIFDSEELELFK